MKPSVEKTSKLSSDQTAPSSVPVPADNNVPAPTVGEMVSHISTIARTNVNGGRIEIGEYLLVNCFNGKTEDASSKNPKKNTSYSEIAKSPDLDLSAKELGICLRVAVLERLLKAESPELCDLKFSVKREIIKLPSTDKMLELARVAYSESLTVDDTRKRLKGMMPHTDPDWGKKLLNGIKNSPLNLLTDDMLKPFCSDRDRLLKDLNKKERTDIRTTAKSKLTDIEECVDLLKGLEKALTEIDAA